MSPTQSGSPELLGLQGPSGLPEVSEVSEVSGVPDLSVALGVKNLRDLLVRAAEQGRNAVCLSDITLPDQPVVWVNEAFTRITGYSFAQTVGRNCRFLQDGLTGPSGGLRNGASGSAEGAASSGSAAAGAASDVRASARRIRELIDARQAGTVVIANRRVDGSVFYNALALSPLPDPSGHVRYYLGVQQDVTEQVLAEGARDRSYAEAAELADQLQNRLVPQTLTASPGWDVAVRYQPATRADGSRGEVSGDFYDLRVRPDGHVLAVLGDVSGRGPRAAATTAALRWSIRGLSSVIDGPGQLLERVAEAVHEALDDRFATVAAVRLPGFPAGTPANASTGIPPTTSSVPAPERAATPCPSSSPSPSSSSSLSLPSPPEEAPQVEVPGLGLGRDVVVALAGHPQPVLIPREGPARFVGQPGMLLGPFGDVEVVDEVVTVHPGDTLVLYTDGVTEAASPRHELLGDAGLLHALDGVGVSRVHAQARPRSAEGSPLFEGLAGPSADEVADAVLAAVTRHVAGGPTDDLTLMVLRRR